MSYLIAKFWGWCLVTICIIYLIRPSTCQIVLNMMKKSEFVLISGWLSIFLGIITLTFNTQNLNSLKIIGAVFTLNGIIRIAFPSMISKEAEFLIKKKSIPFLISGIGLLYGICLLTWN